MSNVCWRWLPEETQQRFEGFDDNMSRRERIVRERPVLVQVEIAVRKGYTNSKVKYWESKYWMRKEATARKLWRSCKPWVESYYRHVMPRWQNINEKVREKWQRYQQLAYKIRKRTLKCHAEIIPVVIKFTWGSAAKMRMQIARVYWKQTKRR